MICASLPVTSLSLLQSAGPSANIVQYRPMFADIGQRTGRSTLADQSAYVGRKQPSCWPSAPAGGIVLLSPATETRHRHNGSCGDPLLSR